MWNDMAEPPSLSEDLLAALRSRLTNSDSLIPVFSEHEKYLTDATEQKGDAFALVMAERESDVVAVVQFCAENKLCVVPRGAGSGLSGGCVPSRGSLVLSTELINHIEINTASRSAVCGPGAITKDLVDAALPFGLTYPPDPASYAESTMGGNVAENAGGLRCKRFGVTRDYVIGLRGVLPDGNVITSGMLGSAGGFSIGDLFIGSEGTLAILTELAVRLIPMPARGATILVAFDRPEDAAQTVSDITGAGIVPTVLEFLDGDAAACSNQYEKTDGLESVAALLLIETSGEYRDQQTEAIGKLCTKNHASHLRVETDTHLAEQLWKVRRNLSKAVKEIASIHISEDVAVPNSQFPALVSWVADLNRKSSLRINAFGHAGDGNLHVYFLSTEGSEQDKELIETLIESLLKKAVALGGTLSGEHGIGLAKRKYLALEYDEPTLGSMRTIKATLDPSNLFNPGKIFASAQKNDPFSLTPS